MSRIFRCVTLAAVLAITMASGGEAEGQIIRYGPYGGVSGFSLRTPSFSIAISPSGATTVRTPFGTRHWASAPPLPHYPHGHGFPPGYSSPQDRYAAPIRPYGSVFPPFGRSPYSMGAPATAESRRVEPESTRPLPFASSPYDLQPTQEFGVTGNAPPRSLSDRELAEALIRAASEFDDALAAQQDGDVWQEYLQPTTIADAFRSTSSLAAGEESLRGLWTNYEAITRNQQLQWVREINGFEATRKLLSEWLQRQASGDDVDRQLEAGEADADAIDAGGETSDAEELPAPAAEPPQVDRPRRYEL